MATEIKMPPLSQTTDTVTLVDWLVKEGETIEKGQPIAEVETDKVNMQVESFTAGTIIELVSSAGDEIPVGDIIAYIGVAGEKPSGKTDRPQERGPQEREPQKSVPKQHAEQQSTPAPGTGKATPLVRNFALKNGVDLSVISGTGPKGLIVKADVERFLKNGGEEAAVSTHAQGAVAAYTETRLAQNQQAVAKNLMKSAREIPHYYVKSTIFMDRALSWRNAAGLKTGPDEKKISIYSLYVYAAAKALWSYPGINGFFKDNTHCMYKDINIGFAISNGHDLFVPVVRQADKKSIGEIDGEVRRLTDKARNGNLDAEDITGATFTLSNLGVYQVDEFTAIITPGQAGIAAIGMIGKKVTADEEDRMQIRQCAVLTGGFDHRIINGADGAAFLERIKGILEKEIEHG
jgi:pyruvate dehydrogenase E2 component (dihydrolipoamide acetyltransferase)